MSAILRSVLTPLIKLWLRSQVESVNILQLQITGKDGEILKGLIPSAAITATGVIYQGLHLSSLALTSSQICLNAPQIIQNQPLRLLEPIQVSLDLKLTPQDLKQCFETALITNALGRKYEHWQNKAETLMVLQELVAKLGDEFHLQQLSYKDDLWQCQGVCTVRAT